MLLSNVTEDKEWLFELLRDRISGLDGKSCCWPRACLATLDFGERRATSLAFASSGFFGPYVTTPT